MKKLLMILISLTLVLSGCCIESRESQVLDTLGAFGSKEFYTSGGFQDYTDFAIYTYAAVDLEDNPYFSPMTERNLEIVSAFLDNFKGWIDTIGRSDPANEVVVNYTFDSSIIDAEDWFYLYEGENYPKYGCYDLWIFDSQTNVLYYFHNNI